MLKINSLYNIFGLMVLVLLGIGLFVSLILTKTEQNITPKAAPSIPRPVIVMDGFEIDPSFASGPTGEIYQQTRSMVTIAVGNLNSRVQSGEISQAYADSLVAEFKSEGKIYLEHTTATKNGSTDPATMVDYWSPVLDIYDGIMIDEYTDSTARDGQSENTIETLKKIREKYPNKIIMPAVTHATGFSGVANPYFNGQVISYKKFWEAARDYADLVFYESYITSGREDEFVFFDTTKQALNQTVPGVLSKIFYGLYVPQTIENIGDSYGADTNPNRSFVGHMARQLQIVRNWTDTAGVGFWVYYRQTPHIAKTVNSLVQSCYRDGSCGVPTDNLFVNPSFEGSFSPWSSSGPVELVNYSTHSACLDGALYNPNLNWCSYMNFGNSGALLSGSRGRAHAGQSVNLEVGQTYYLKVFAKKLSGDGRLTAHIQFGNGTVNKTFPEITSDRWQAREVWFRATGSSATIVIESACGGDFYIDSIKLEKTVYTESNLLSGFEANCGGSATPAPSPVPSPTLVSRAGDINNDGLVSMLDIGIIIEHFDKLPISDSRADINKDGKVSMLDLGVVIEAFDR